MYFLLYDCSPFVHDIVFLFLPMLFFSLLFKNIKSIYVWRFGTLFPSFYLSSKLFAYFWCTSPHPSPRWLTKLVLHTHRGGSSCFLIRRLAKTMMRCTNPNMLTSQVPIVSHLIFIYFYSCYKVPFMLTFVY